MSESETPIDQNTTGGEPLPVSNEQDDVEASRLALSPQSNTLDDSDGVNNEEDSDDDDEEEEEDSDDEEDEDFMAELPNCVRHRVEKMKELNLKRDAMMEEYLDERAKLEKKYADLCQPLYEERSQIIIGKRDGDIKKAITVTDDDGDEDEENLVGVPEFWSCCIHNIEAVSELVTERDNECLLLLENIVSEDFDDGKGFELQFYFKEDNPYFTNKCLTKRYEVPNLLLNDEPILKNVTGCEIQWKPNMALTFREVTKKQRSKSGKKAGQIRTITKRERTDSFFHFFSPPKIPSMNDMDEDEADAMEEAFDHDYDVAQSFRSHIIPKAVMWFTGEAMQDEFERMMGTDAEGVLAQLNSMGAGPAVPGGNPFPPPANGTEEPECKQS